MSSSSDGAALVDQEEANREKAPPRRFYRSWLLGITVFLLYGVSIWILLKFVQFSISYDGYIPYFRRKLPDLLDGIDIDCDGVISGNYSNIKLLKTWQFNTASIEEQLAESEDKCSTINELFSFNLSPLSQEEEDFPLGYGLVVYKNIIQVLFMLSAFYHPQNLYCIAVSGTAKSSFKEAIHYLPLCFSNIYILDRPPISWGSFEIINSTYSCMESLSRRNHTWQYFQYLSGVDAPLKTNLEMVRILKQLGGNVNVEVKEYPPTRARTKNVTNSPLPLFKSSLSAVIPRAAADFMASNVKTRQQLAFLKDTAIPDESFWATVTGNIKDFPIPGGFDAKKMLEIREQIKSQNITEEAEIPRNYYISRKQIWMGGECYGKMSSGSCVYGVKDIPALMKQPALVAHKFYSNFEPAAYFCALKEIRKRTLEPVPFDASSYSKLPQYELLRGISPENLTHPSWL